MTVDPRTPVIVGVGQYVHRAATIDEFGARRLDGRGGAGGCCDAGLSWRALARSTRSASSTCSRGATATRRGSWADVSASRPRRWRTRPPAATRHRPSSIARRSTSPPAGPTSWCSPGVRRGGRGCGSSARHESRLGQGTRGRDPVDHRRRTGDDASRRGGPRHRPARAGVPLFESAIEPPRAPHRTSTSPGSPGCGHASARSPRTIRTPGRG